VTAQNTLIRKYGRLLVLGGVAVLLIAGIATLFKPASTKKVTARFDRAVGLYTASSVRLHGVSIGKITKVKPDGNGVIVEMEYDKKVKLPAYPDDAKVVRAAIIPPSLVSDRYVEFLDFTSCKGQCEVLPDGASIPQNQTASPVELDDIYGALGPKGANAAAGGDKRGPLAELLDVGAANLDGNGKALGESVQNLARAAKTLADGREDLFGTVKNLQVFTDALVANDAHIRTFNSQLQQVSGALADDRQSLAAALKNLAVALKDISGFIKQNGDTLHADVVGLKNVTDMVLKQKAALNEILSVAPVALANLVHTYNPRSGTLDTRSNLGQLADPAIVCGILQNVGALGTLSSAIQGTCKKIGDLLGGLPLPGFGQPGTGGAPVCLPGGVLPTVPGVTCK